MELVQGVRNKDELRALRSTVRLNGWRILPLTEAIGHRATLYLETFALSHGLRLADGLIACAVTRLSIAPSKPLRDNPMAARASLSLRPIMYGTSGGAC